MQCCLNHQPALVVYPMDGECPACMAEERIAALEKALERLRHDPVVIMPPPIGWNIPPVSSTTEGVR